MLFIMRILTVPLRSNIKIIGWIGLLVFAMHASIFFLSSEHTMLFAPCAGMSQAVCPILGHDLMRFDHSLIVPKQPEILLHSSHTALNDISIMAAAFFILSLFVCAWQHIRKRNYFYKLFHRYQQAFSSGILHSRIYA